MVAPSVLILPHFPTQGKQCPEERNSLIYDVMFVEYHARRSGASRQQMVSPNAKST